MDGHLSENTITTLFEKEGLHPFIMPDGEVEIPEEIPARKFRSLRAILRKAQFEILIDRNKILAEKVSRVIQEMIHHSRDLPAIRFSVHISRKLCTNYSFLSKAFSKTKGITIEKYIIIQKIERVKRLLVFPDLNLSQIALKLHYSSIAHLSSQFKKVTGITPSDFRKSKAKNWIHLRPGAG